MLTLTIPLKVTSAANAWEHWRARVNRQKRERTAIEAAWLAAGHVQTAGVAYTLGQRGRRVAVTLTRIAPRMLDDDNNVTGFKHIRDVVAGCMGVDDRDPRVEWRYSQERGKPKEYAVRVRIETAPRNAQAGRGEAQQEAPVSGDGERDARATGAPTKAGR